MRIELNYPGHMPRHPEIEVYIMTHYDEQLKQLAQQVSRAKQLQSMVAELRAQEQNLSARARELETVMHSEQSDVDRLEGHSLAAFFYNLTGKIDEKLAQERREAYAARLKYDTAVRELNDVRSDLARYEREWDSLQNCEKQYAAVLAEKAAALKAAGGAHAEKVLQLEERISFLDSQRKELYEAVSSGHAALSAAESVLSSLDSAEGWSTWDLMGGGMLTDMAKHSHLNDAQRSIEVLQSRLRNFKTELADVTIRADLQVTIDGFLYFADYFFDGLFSDWAVRDQIHRSQEQVEGTRRQINQVLSQLDSMRQQTEEERTRLKETLDDLVLNA